MPLFSTIFGLDKSQAELDFVDVETSTDTRLYLDPYAIEIRGDEWSTICGDYIRSYFNELLDALRNDNMQRAIHLLSHLHEPNETFLGQSEGPPQGRGVGEEKAAWLTAALLNSRAFQTGVLADISEAELFIRGVGPDTISDLTTNVLRGLLANYTVEQCALHRIPTSIVNTLGPVWNPVRGDWEAMPLSLPIVNHNPALLVPKFSIRHRLSLDSQEFWTHHMVNFLQQEYLHAGGSLVQVLKNGTRRVTKKSVKERHPFIKDDLATFVSQHPEVLETYKSIKGTGSPISNRGLNEDFDESAFAIALIERLRQVQGGGDSASEYHSLALGICTFVFFPNLICPFKEHEIHRGRKRIDIKFTNSAEHGFFRRMLEAPQTRSLSVPIECKNYTKEMNNPELDQLAGRFGHSRGFFGMVFCRHMDNRQRIIEGCRDTAMDGRGFMIVFEDEDVIHLLELIRDGRRNGIDSYLQRRFDEIAH